MQYAYSCLLAQLADGKRYTASMLLKISKLKRNGLNRAITYLQHTGLAIEHFSDDSYQLQQSIECLSLGAICKYLGKYHHQIITRFATTSTNTYLLKRLDRLTKGTILISEHQFQGRGRQGNIWHSSPACSITLSIAWRISMQTYPALGLCIGVVIIHTLGQLGVKAQLKWPNDILLNGRKLGGILLETCHKPQTDCNLVIGIGINYQHSNTLGADVATLCNHTSAQVYSRNQITALLVANLMEMLERLSHASYKDLLLQWQYYDYYCHKPISLRVGCQTIQGIAQGIDHQGSLLLLENNKIKSYCTGNIVLPRIYQLH